MKDQIISFETAELAKKKGFNIPLIQKGHVYNTETRELDHAISSDQIQNWNDDGYSMICSAPTQSLLQKWLRDIHNIYVWSNPISIDDFKYTILSNEYLKFHSDKFGFISYEEALEEGLQEALKLIKHE